MNKKIWFVVAFSLFVSGLSGQNIRNREDFNSNWRFFLGQVVDAEKPGFNDASWRQLNLPHDWSIEGEFSEKNPATPGGGALPGGLGWYRKTFKLAESDKGKKIFVEFDGVYRNSEVWINGHFLGKRPFGYISFSYELTPFLKFGNESNLITVKVDNSQQPNSRWYSGSGIYRNVWLTTVNPVHIPQWGTYVTTPQVSDKEADMEIQVRVKNQSDEKASFTLQSSVFDNSGKLVAATKSDVSVDKDSISEFTQNLKVANPQLWSFDNPNLYKVITEIKMNGKAVDVYETPLGIRSFSFDAKKGFVLNGKQQKILGVCNHHDLGCLGAAINTRALERQLEILKEMGCNAIRTSHNPPAPELLTLCDRMGFFVMDEAFDMWRKRKSPFDYSNDFNTWHERDLTDQILRDRNHPSVFMWSIGNEVLEQWTDAKADTLDLQQANLLLNLKRNIDPDQAKKEGTTVNMIITRRLAEIVRSLDKTRPITAGNNESRPINHLFRANTLDVVGYNYHEKDALKASEWFPGMPFIFTETTSALMTRGYYRMPSDSMYIWPKRWDKPFSDPSMSCSSYDNCHAPWGSTHETTWKMVKNNDFVSGLFIWTGFDYLGEPTPYWWPARSSYFGIIDLAGFPKDVYYMYQSEWTKKDVLHIFPHWNWTPGDSVDVWAYTNAPEVELFLNGKSLGTKTKGTDDLHLQWRVKFEPGTLKAISKKNGKVVLQQEVKTANAPAKLALTTDRSTIKADGCDLSFVTVSVLDKDGTLAPNADNLVNFEVEGPAVIAGVDNGSPISHEPFKANYRKAFYGKCLVVLQSTGKAGEIVLKAKSSGLNEAKITVTAK
jgi:beta-galactosidase